MAMNDGLSGLIVELKTDGGNPRYVNAATGAALTADEQAEVAKWEWLDVTDVRDGLLGRQRFVRGVERRKVGRPRVADERTEVSLLLPNQWHDEICREALARDVSVAAIIRDAVAAMLRQRGANI